jgi:hypothetical protein
MVTTFRVQVHLGLLDVELNARDLFGMLTNRPDMEDEHGNETEDLNDT